MAAGISSIREVKGKTPPPKLSAKAQATEDAIIDQEAARVDGEIAKKPELPGLGDPKDVENVSGQRLKSYLDRIDRLEEEKKGFIDDIKDIYAEAKGVGFDTKTIRKLVKLRKMDTNKRHEEEEILELYKAAVGLD